MQKDSMTKEHRHLLKKLFWDYNFTEEELFDLLEGKTSRAGHLDTTGLYARMLSTLQWYDILEVVGKDRLEEMLSDTVLGRLRSADLKKKYAVAKRVLFQ